MAALLSFLTKQSTAYQGSANRQIEYYLEIGFMLMPYLDAPGTPACCKQQFIRATALINEGRSAAPQPHPHMWQRSVKG